MTQSSNTRGPKFGAELGQSLELGRDRILEVLNYELATHTPAAWIEVFEQCLSLWCQQQFQQSQRPLLSLVPPSLLAHGAQVIVKRTFGTSPSPWTPDPVTWELQRGSSLVRSGCVSNWQESAWVTQLRFVPSGRAPLHFILSFVRVAPVAPEVCQALSVGECLI